MIAKPRIHKTALRWMHTIWPMLVTIGCRAPEEEPQDTESLDPTEWIDRAGNTEDDVARYQILLELSESLDPNAHASL